MAITKDQLSSVANSPPQNFLSWAVKTAVFCVFLAGQSVVVNFSQFLGLVLWPFSKFYYQSYIDHTQRSFGVLLVAINHFFAPCNFVITTDESAKGIVKHTWNGAKVELDIPEKIILISNHQIYADWLYIWQDRMAFAYLANAHGALKIILKESLKWLPIFGWGMQFFRFIFLHRNWTKDKRVMDKSLSELADSNDPLWLLIFPEGTLVSESTRKTSRNFAEKNNLVDPKFVLLPRSTGLFFCTNKLQKSIEYIYDLTIGFEGVRANEYPEDIYTLRKIYFESKFPPNIHIHVRKYCIADLPSDEIKFSEWLRARWNEKDRLMNEFYTNGRFLSVYDHQKVVPVQMNSVFELAQIWYFVIPLAPLVWYLLNV